jgi:hypothetical protein
MGREGLARMAREPLGHLAMTLSLGYRSIFAEEGLGIGACLAPRYGGHGCLDEKLGIALPRFASRSRLLRFALPLALFASTAACALLALVRRDAPLGFFVLPSVYGFSLYAAFSMGYPRFSQPLLPVAYVCLVVVAGRALARLRTAFTAARERYAAS